MLYRVVQEHWPAFRQRAEEHGGLPRFVVDEFEAFLECGLPEYGCLALACTQCKLEHLVAFSCKKRGFCPSCLGRRMHDTALHLCERVIPEVPVRQWVLTVPYRLRVLMGYDRRVCARVARVFAEEVMRWTRLRAKHVLSLPSVDQAKTGAVTFVQRVDSALRLNVHLHTIALDGVYTLDGSGTPVFTPLPAPTRQDVEHVAARTARRMAKHLDRAEEEGDVANPDEPLQTLLQLAGLGSSSRAGSAQPLRLVASPDALVAEVDGYNVHAQVAFHGRDRKRLERLCRYLARPPLANERLELREDGTLRYMLKTPWRDGTCAVSLTPEQLLARLCASIPPPRFHSVRFFGVLSSHAKDRSSVIPALRVDCAPKTVQQLSLFGLLAPSDRPAEPPPPSRKPWAWLLRYVFRHDVESCPRCGGRMKWREVATRPHDIQRLMYRHGLVATPPPPRPPPNGQLSLSWVG